jgi:hypothetical protein
VHDFPALKRWAIFTKPKRQAGPWERVATDDGYRNLIPPRRFDWIDETLSPDGR